MEQDAVPYQKILFVCINRRPPGEVCCAHRDGEAIAAALKARIKALGLSRLVRVSKSGCQDLCAQGPNVMVFPEGTWYHGVSQQDVERIVQDTVRGLSPTFSPRAPSA
jgi:(2Fe-2S) ferredoxin